MSTPKKNQGSSAPSLNTNNSANGNGNGNGHVNANASFNSGGASHHANPPSYMAMMALNGNMGIGFQQSGGRNGASSSMSMGSRRSTRE